MWSKSVASRQAHLIAAMVPASDAKRENNKDRTNTRTATTEHKRAHEREALDANCKAPGAYSVASGRHLMMESQG